jgi:serine/threonine-protein kinase
MLRPGDLAPEIDAPASQGGRFKLSEQRGKLCTVVYFFPKAFTPGCTLEATRFRDNYPELALAGATLVGVSADKHDTECNFASSLRLPFPLIGDHDKAICRAYDTLWPVLGLTKRVTYIINPLRVIEGVVHQEIDIGQHRNEVLRVMDRLQRSRRTSLAPPSSGRSIPQVAPPYELLAEAGSGAMGIVYRAREHATGRTVAVKLLAGAGETNRFALETMVLSKLEHPGIVSYIAHGTATDGRFYLVTEWVEGESLHARIKRGPMPLDEALRVAHDVASALAAAHARGVIHRDVKPSNVLLPPGDGAKLLDFGIARSTKNISTKLTQTGQMVGTPGYASPEQIKGVRDVDPRTDLFGLGCLVYACIAGHAPFRGPDMMARLFAVLEAPAPHLEGVPAELDALVQELLAKEPEGRPASAAVVRERLAALRGVKHA